MARSRVLSTGTEVDLDQICDLFYALPRMESISRRRLMSNHGKIHWSVGLVLVIFLTGLGCETLHNAGVPGLETVSETGS